MPRFSPVPPQDDAPRPADMASEHANIPEAVASPPEGEATLPTIPAEQFAANLPGDEIPDDTEELLAALFDIA